MNDPTYNNILKWGIQNSDASLKDPSAPPPKPMSDADREALASLLTGYKGPSEAVRMGWQLDAIEGEDVEKEAKYTAFMNLETLIQNIDNANNLENDKMWDRLIRQLENADPEMRRWAAWCCGTAVQNNVRSQERLLVMGVIPTLVRLATADTERVRRKACTALSSAVRNFQPNLDAAISHVPAEYKPKGKLDANDMASVDILINKLRESI